jgi:hypothetical protein
MDSAVFLLFIPVDNRSRSVVTSHPKVHHSEGCVELWKGNAGEGLLMKSLFLFCLTCVAMAANSSTGSGSSAATPNPVGSFPVATQFTPVPSGDGWKGEEGPLSEQVIRDTIDNIIKHGFSGIEAPTRRPPAEETFILKYAQERGMFISWLTGGLEGFGRDEPPNPSVYSPNYASTMKKNVEQALDSVKEISRLYNFFAFQDEPFTAGVNSFSHDDEAKAEFKKRYEYELPDDVDSVRSDPQKWRDLLNFQTSKFPDAWRQVYSTIKSINPNYKVTMTHDSHNTFGGGLGSNAQLAIDDVFHWGGDFADMFVYDIYPYMMYDFRFGEPSKFPVPRMSQTHYSFAQMRNLTRHYGKDLGFWVGTYNPNWFKSFLCTELCEKTWVEGETSATAVAAGANYLLTGYGIPTDPAHWEAFGRDLRRIQKTGGALLSAPRVKANACMLFPREQYLQLQEEYFNVGLSFELFSRAFGELDVLHEEQVTDERLDGYKILVLFDVKLLPRDVADRIAAFARNGGLVIADCVPQLDENRLPMNAMTELFGVAKADTGRIPRTGSWIPFKDQPSVWFAGVGSAQGESENAKDVLKAGAWEGGPAIADVVIPSFRACEVGDGEVLARTVENAPAIIRKATGAGSAYLFCFCAQDAYFKAWRDGDDGARAQLQALIAEPARLAGVKPHVHSSNPDIEAALRANEKEAFLFVINHEARAEDVLTTMSDVGFVIEKITDVEDGSEVSFHSKQGIVTLETRAPLGEFRLFRLTP